MAKINYCTVDTSTRQICGTGRSYDQATFDLQPVADGCELVEFTGGIVGHYLIDGEMQSDPPSE